jgi:hypothetical protein
MFSLQWVSRIEMVEIAPISIQAVMAGEAICSECCCMVDYKFMIDMVMTNLAGTWDKLGDVRCMAIITLEFLPILIMLVGIK